MKDWTYVLKRLNQNRDKSQVKFTKNNTPKSLYDFWVNYR